MTTIDKELRIQFLGEGDLDQSDWYICVRKCGDIITIDGDEFKGTWNEAIADLISNGHLIDTLKMYRETEQELANADTADK
jgi:hypothetical protein